MPYDWDAEPPFAARIDEKYGYINGKGKTVIPFIYDEAGSFCYGRADVKKDGKAGMLDEKGNVAVPFEYDEIIDTWEDLTIAERGETIVLLDGGEEVLSLPSEQCEQVMQFSDSFAWMKVSGSWLAVGEPLIASVSTRLRSLKREMRRLRRRLRRRKGAICTQPEGITHNERLTNKDGQRGICHV